MTGRRASAPTGPQGAGPGDAMLPLLVPLPGRGTAHDLPPRWDGRKVAWEPWREEPQTFICGRGTHDQIRCATCRTNQPRLTCTGTTAAEGAHPARRLLAYRCRGCGHDTVVELARQGMQVWDLDDSDYGDVGSHDPTPHAYDH